MQKKYEACKKENCNYVTTCMSQERFSLRKNKYIKLSPCALDFFFNYNCNINAQVFSAEKTFAYI